MARSTWTPPPRPDPSTLKNPAPFAPFPLSHLRAGRVKKFGPFESAIQKGPLPFPVTITKNGIPGDEHAYEPHRHPDKALLHYCTSHYEKWKSEIPASADLFRPGAFGEGVFSEEVSEMNVCIGDRIAIGEVVLEVTEPRAPCFKLNHRFEVRDMAKRVQTLFRAGWLYRVIEPGTVYEGDMIRLLERPLPEWTVARVMYYMFLEMENMEMTREIVALEPLGWEVKEKFQARLKKGETEDQDGRMYGDVAMDTWSECRIVEKRRETGKVTAFVLEAVDVVPDPKPVEPGSHVRVKLGGKLVRAYSVVGGSTKRFELGVSLEPQSRGGSKYLHEQAKEGDVLTVGQITASFPLAEEADQHVIIAAGIGITAFTTALEYLQKSGQNFHLHYAHAGEIPFVERIKAVGDKATIYDKSHSQRLKVDDIVSRTDSRTHIYTCGPQRLMDNVVAAAKKYSVPDSNVHLEQFTVTTSGDPFTVELKESNKLIEVGPTQSLLDVLRSIGMSVDSSCEVGNCGTCKVDVCEGRVEHRGTGLMEDEKKESMLSCVSRGIGRIVLDL